MLRLTIPYLIVVVQLAWTVQATDRTSEGPQKNLDTSYYVGDIRQRSVSDIVRSCWLTIFACNWASVHPNIPGPNEGKVKRVLHRVRLMCWGIIAPEMLIYWAMRQWFGARQVVKKHRASPKSWTKTHGFFIQMGGFMLYDGTTPKKTLSLEALEDLENKGKIDWPEVTEAELGDKSKGDAFTKCLTLIQTTWFIIQIFARLSAHLSIAALEVVTVSYAVLNSMMYFFWWNKPLAVGFPIPVKLKRSGQESDSDNVTDKKVQIWKSSKYPVAYVDMALGPVSHIFQQLSQSLSDMKESPRSTTIEHGMTHVPTYYALESSLQEWKTIRIASLVAATIFGSLHFIAWFSSFPSQIEGVMWRTSSLTITLIPLVFALRFISASTYASEAKCQRQYAKAAAWATLALLVHYISNIAAVLYMVARIGLLAQTLLELRALPPSAFQTISWVSLIPHV